jgi:hypothetical protein
MTTHQSKAQKATVSRVMHEFKHGELETSRGRKVRNPKQAIAIGLREAGASKYESKKKNRENLLRTKARERRGATENDRSERADDGQTRAELYAEAKRRDIPGRSRMSKESSNAPCNRANRALGPIFEKFLADRMITNGAFWLADLFRG